MRGKEGNSINGVSMTQTLVVKVKAKNMVPRIKLMLSLKTVGLPLVALCHPEGLPIKKTLIKH